MKKIFFLNAGQIADLRTMLDEATAERRQVQRDSRDKSSDELPGARFGSDRERLLDNRIGTLETILKHV